MNLSRATKLLVVTAGGAGVIAVLQYLQNVSVWSVSSLSHAMLAGLGVAATLFVRQETAALQAPAPPESK